MLLVNRDILKLAVPSILANFTIPLVGIVDTAIVGHLSDAAAIGGIAIGTMLFDLLYWNFGFLRISTSGLTAQAFGRGTEENDECGKILSQSVSIALIGALFVWAIQWFFVTAVLAIVPCSPEVAEVARSYLGCSGYFESDGSKGLVHRHAGCEECDGGGYRGKCH